MALRVLDWGKADSPPLVSMESRIYDALPGFPAGNRCKDGAIDLQLVYL